MRKREAFLVAGLVLLLLGVGAWQCAEGGTTPERCPTCSPCLPSATCPHTLACEATVTSLETQVAACEATLTACCETPPDCNGAISCKEAKFYYGEFKTVQGLFYCSYHPNVNGQPTFCNCPVPYPNHDFTVLIWGDKRPIFESCLGGPPELLLDNREFCVSGLIEEYDGKPEIVLRECNELTGLQ